ncbi:hypothetical protein A2U01_0118822, partial [Trifolium medium]|nr:hypothetical protein [Trifolium medium]
VSSGSTSSSVDLPSCSITTLYEDLTVKVSGSDWCEPEPRRGRVLN